MNAIRSGRKKLTRKPRFQLLCCAAVSCVIALPSQVARAETQWAISANDGHTTTDSAGKMVTARLSLPDNVTLIKFDQGRPVIGKSLDLPTSVEGPPTTVWIAPDSSWSIVTAGSHAGTQSGAPVIEDDLVSVISITQGTPKLTQTVHAGLGASQVSVSPDQKWVLITNRRAGTVSVFAVKRKHLFLDQTLVMGAGSNPASVRFMPDGEHAVVILRGRHQLILLRKSGKGFTIDDHKLSIGHSPNTLDITQSGLIAVGDQDTDRPSVHLILLNGGQPMLLQTVPVAPSPEPLRFSPNGRYLAVGAVNNSNKDPSAHGTVTLYHFDKAGLTPVSTANVGRWPQGIIFSPDGGTLLVQNTADKTMTTLHWDGTKLQDAGTIPMVAGPAAADTAW